MPAIFYQNPICSFFCFQPHRIRSASWTKSCVHLGMHEGHHKNHQRYDTHFGMQGPIYNTSTCTRGIATLRNFVKDSCREKWDTWTGRLATPWKKHTWFGTTIFLWGEDLQIHVLIQPQQLSGIWISTWRNPPKKTWFSHWKDIFPISLLVGGSFCWDTSIMDSPLSCLWVQVKKITLSMSSSTKKANV